MAATLINGEGEPVTVDDAMKNKKALALYFGAKWLPPCRTFKTRLAEWYKNDLSSKGLEVVFVSSDRSTSAFKELC